MAEKQPTNQEEGGRVEKQKKGKGKVIIIILLILVIIALAVVIFLLLRKKPEPEAPAAAEAQRGLLVNEENMEQIAEELAQPSTAPQSYDVTMNSTWNFESGSESSTNAYVENATSNQNDVYFDVTLADTGETILESPIIPVGSHMDSIKLDKNLSKGTYDCIMTYHLLDNEQKSVSTVKLALTINVLN